MGCRYFNGQPISIKISTRTIAWLKGTHVPLILIFRKLYLPVFAKIISLFYRPFVPCYIVVVTRNKPATLVDLGII
jgi:hypothetical protein